MASRILEVIIAAKDQATAVLGKVQEGMGGFKAKAEAMAKGVSDGLNSMLGRWLSIGAIVGVLKTSSDAANEFAASIRKLEGTAKIAGVPLETLQDIADKGRRAFGLSAVTANDLTVAVSKLATKAGDLGMSSDLMERFLDLGAAKGLSATETLKAVEQSILGIDEGTDKLFGKNPSVLYQEFAAAIGTTAGKLTDQEKAMAIATAAMEDGGKVVGAYRDYLQSAAGQQDQARQKMDEAAATLGTALVPAFTAAAEAVQWVAGKIGEFIGGIQIMSVELSGAAMSLGPAFKAITGSVLTMLGDVFAKLADVPVIGWKFADVATSLQTSGRQMVQSNRQALTAIRETVEEETAKIVGVQIDGGRRRVQAEVATGRGVAGASASAGQQLTDQQKAVNRERERLSQEIAVKTIQLEQGLTEAEAREYLRRQELLGRSVRTTVTSLEAGWEEVHKLNVWLAVGLNRTLVPAVENTDRSFLNLRTTAQTIPTTFAPVEESATSVAKRTADAAAQTEHLTEQLEKGARGAIGLASGLFGMSDAAANAANNLVSVVSSAKELFGSAFKGDLAGTITQLVGSAVSLIKGIFGESPEEKARKQLLRDNTAALKLLTQATGDLAKVSAPGSEVARIRDFLGGLFGPQGQYTKGSYTSGKMKAGITDADIEKLAGELGITVRNSKSGAIESGALFQLFQALQGLDAGFANTYAGQLDRLTKGLSLGAITKSQEFGQLLSAIGTGGPNAISRALAGADFGSMEGRLSAAGSLRDLFTNIGSLRAQDLGGLNQTEFLDALQRLVDILTDPEQAIEAIATGTPDTPGLDLSSAFGDLTVSFEDIGTQQIDYLASIDTGIGSLLERWTDIDTGRVAQAPVTITVGEVTVNTAATDAAGTGDAVRAAVTEAINRALADAYLDRQLATGNVTRTVS